MKRFLLVAALLIAPALLADTSDRAVLLAPNGTLFTIASQANNDNTSIASTRYLSLSIQNGKDIVRTNAPASLTGGINWQPELAFDSESHTLFVFWLHSRNPILASNELLFCTFQDGKWNEASSIEDIPYHFRYNLRIGVTKSVQTTDENGNPKQVPALSVHAAWWDESGEGERARYAMLSIDNGIVTALYVRDLQEFVNPADTRSYDVDEKTNEALRHPVIFESPTDETVDVLFGDMQTNTIHRLTLKPVVQTRVRIPIGVRHTGYPAPSTNMTADSHLEGIATPGERLAFYYTATGSVRYLTFEHGAWSSEISISVTEEVSADAAVGALRRMVRGE